MKNWWNEYPALTYRWTFAGNACYEVLAPVVSRCGCGFSGVRVKRGDDVAHGDFRPYFLPLFLHLVLPSSSSSRGQLRGFSPGRSFFAERNAEGEYKGHVKRSYDH